MSGARGVARETVRGIGVDGQTRCVHYRGPLDVVAMRMKCCGEYYACRECHDGIADHDAQVWPRKEWDQAAVLCGACGAELTIRQYLECADCCPACGAGFNPGCRKHRQLYFDAGEDQAPGGKA